MEKDQVLRSEGGEARVAEGTLRAYVGRYRSDDPNHPVGITLTLQGGRLFIQNDNGSAVPLYAESSTKFYLKNQETEIVFDAHVAGRFEFLNYAPVGVAVFNRISGVAPGGILPK